MTLREMLDLIDTFLVDNPEGGQLWDILSALRGPDLFNSGELKERTTMAIRGAAFPQVLKSQWHGMNKPWVGQSWPAARDRHYWDGSACGVDHFGNHARHAAEALGLQSPK